MTTITARVEFADEDHNQAVVRVQTSRCFYSVAIEGEEITVVGPGIEKKLNLEEINEDFSLFDNLSFKGKAIIAVTLLEEEE